MGCFAQMTKHKYDIYAMAKQKAKALHSPVKFILSLSACFIVAAFGSGVTVPSISSWYSTLVKPDFNPPDWIFGPVWTVLFFMMAIAWYLVWTTNGKQKAIYICGGLFLLQLLLNFLWSFLFFFLHQPFLAFVDIIFLWCAILLTLIHFWRVSRLAGQLFLPYLAWVSFAGVLNGSIVLLN